MAKITVKQLKERLRELGCSVTGNKAELLARLDEKLKTSASSDAGQTLPNCAPYSTSVDLRQSGPDNAHTTQVFVPAEPSITVEPFTPQKRALPEQELEIRSKKIRFQQLPRVEKGELAECRGAHFCNNVASPEENSSVEHFVESHWITRLLRTRALKSGHLLKNTFVVQTLVSTLDLHTAQVAASAWCAMFTKLVCEEELDAEIILGTTGADLCISECIILDAVFARVLIGALGPCIVLQLTGEVLGQSLTTMRIDWQMLAQQIAKDPSYDLMELVYFKRDDAENTRWKHGISPQVLSGGHLQYTLAKRFALRNAEIQDPVQEERSMPRMLLENHLGVMQVDMSSNKDIPGLARIVTTGGHTVFVVRDTGHRIGDENFVKIHEKFLNSYLYSNHMIVLILSMTERSHLCDHIRNNFRGDTKDVLSPVSQLQMTMAEELPMDDVALNKSRKRKIDYLLAVLDSPGNKTMTSSSSSTYCPWDRDQLLFRLKTFQSWDDHELNSPTSAFQLARAGWSYLDLGSVECIHCHARVTIKLQSEEDGVYQALQQRFGEIVKTSHTRNCPWMRVGCSRTLIKEPVNDQREAFAGFRRRIKLISQFFVPVREQIQLELNSNIQLTTEEQLALTGWVTVRERTIDMLTCQTCFVRVLVRNETINLLDEHLPYCPWICKVTQGCDAAWILLGKYLQRDREDTDHFVQRTASSTDDPKKRARAAIDSLLKYDKKPS